MKKILLVIVTILAIGTMAGSLRAQTVSPHIGATYLRYNSNTIAGGTSSQVNMFTGQSITVQINGANYGTGMAEFGGIDLEIWEVTTPNNNQIDLTSINSPGANSGQNTWWVNSTLPTGQVAHYLHMESVWSNWNGGGSYMSMNVSFTALQPGTYHLYAKMYLADSSGNLPRDPSGTTPNTDDQGQGTYLIGTVNVSGYPDLVIQAPALGSTSLQSGASSNVTYFVYNQGNQPAGTFRVGIYLSTSQYSPGTLLTTQTVSGLGVNSRYIGNNVFTIPSNTPSGNYYIVVYADDQNQVAESNENNNTDGVAVSVTLATTSVTVTTNPSGLGISVDGTSYTSPQTFSNWTIGSSHTIVTTSTQSGGAGTQYVWSNWSDGGSISHTITAPSGGATYTANFTTQYYLTMTSVANGGGTPLSGWYNGGASVSINAAPSTGYSFSGWTGSGSISYSGPNNPASVTMNSPVTETPSFSAIPVTLPDLTIKSFTLSPLNPTTADNITFTAVIWNNSSVSCGASVASLKVGGESNPPVKSQSLCKIIEGHAASLYEIKSV